MRRDARRVECLSELRPCPMQPDPYGVAGAAENGSNLSVVQPLPRHQREQLAVGIRQSPERGADSGELGGEVGGELNLCQLGAQPVTQTRAPSFAPMVVGKHTAGDAVEPQP